jgi:uncharacterized membrane protein YphA (DoxX/SURF4 family)
MKRPERDITTVERVARIAIARRRRGLPVRSNRLQRDDGADDAGHVWRGQRPQVSARTASTAGNNEVNQRNEVAMRILHTSPTRGPDPTAAAGGAADQRACCAKDVFRIAFGMVWLIDAGFKWQSGFVHGFRDMVNSAGQGQPSWLHWFYTLTHNVFTPHPYVWAYAIAGLETLIGIALILGFARKITYIVTAVTGFGIWAVAEGFGGPYSSSSTDIGAAVMYAVVALGLLALNYEAGPSRFSVDYLVEQRIPWWHRVAEVEGRRRAVVPVTDEPALEPEWPSAHAPVIT